jgi:hypothetical protein
MLRPVIQSVARGVNGAASRIVAPLRTITNRTATSSMSLPTSRMSFP